jgi:hypothetical protein
LKDKFTADDKKTIEELSAQGLQFVNSANDAAAEEFENK